MLRISYKGTGHIYNFRKSYISQNGLKDYLSRGLKRILHKSTDRLCPDNKKVITRFFEGGEALHRSSIIKRAIDLDKGQTLSELKKVMSEFSKRHENIESIFMANYERVANIAVSISSSLSKEKKLLIGSLFTMEYSYESTSLFNPSVVLHPDQNNLKKGQIRVVFSFRATGEGHISSIIFRNAVIDKYGDIYLEPISRFASTPVVNMTPPCNYEVSFPSDQPISERVLFPMSHIENHGIEDARLVRLQDNGNYTYYATYTACNGSILPRILETKDFLHFKMSTLNGPFAKDKGMALFPRKINGKYAMISRADNENLYLSYSDNILFWHEGVKMQEPSRPWEMLKIGNCGSPIETKEGWLLLTHGVGPGRKYCIGIELLDLNDPSKIIAKMAEPLISPKLRSGYVPNVVYSCGPIRVGNKLIIPYASNDSVSSIAVIGLNELLDKLLNRR